MEHRHLNTQTWSAAAIASALERGGLQDWQDLFAAVQRHRDVAALVLRVAAERELDGASILAEALVRRLQPHPEAGDRQELRGIVRDSEARVAGFKQLKKP